VDSSTGQNLAVVHYLVILICIECLSVAVYDLENRPAVV